MRTCPWPVMCWHSVPRSTQKASGCRRRGRGTRCHCGHLGQSAVTTEAVHVPDQSRPSVVSVVSTRPQLTRLGYCAHFLPRVMSRIHLGEAGVARGREERCVETLKQGSPALHVDHVGVFVENLHCGVEKKEQNERSRGCEHVEPSGGTAGSRCLHESLEAGRRRA